MVDFATDQGLVEHYLPTVFVSDVHLGSRYCQAERFLQFLEAHRIGDLYLVGDMIDGWRLRRKWWWPDVYHRIFHRLLAMNAAGTRLYYTPGNHDEFLRHYLRDFGFVDIANEFVYESIGGERFLVTHGDQFDHIESSMPWLSHIGASAYEMLMWLNHVVNRGRRLCSLPDWRFSTWAKHSVKGAVKFMSSFEHALASHARAKGCDGIICGHIHAPTMRDHEDIAYFNTGDWVEHCTALIEHQDGTWELRDFLSGFQRGSGETSDGTNLLQRIRRGTRPRGTSRRPRRQLPASA